ncbi:NAD(P)-dependent alcohol dehydrogenase [Streptomyces shaanxiensis]
MYGEADGTFAEFVCAKDTETDLKPAGLTFEQAAAMPLAANTALIGLRDVAGVRAGQSVLVNGASGGVGTFAVQLAKAFGARVTGVCGARNVELRRITRRRRRGRLHAGGFTRAGRRYDVVLDLVGNRSLADLRRATRTPSGTVVLSGGGVFEGGGLLAGVAHGARTAARPLRASTRAPAAGEGAQGEPGGAAGTRRRREDRPAVERMYPLSEAAEAIRHLEVEHARAKIVVTVGGASGP